MNALIHYDPTGSASPAWIREMLAIENEGELAPAPPSAGPMFPEFPRMRSAGDRAPVGAPADEVRQLNALTAMSGPDSAGSYSGEGHDFTAHSPDCNDFRLMRNIMGMRSRLHHWEYVRELAFQGALELYWEGGV